MKSGGENVEDYLRVVRVQIDALGATLDDALGVVPPQLRNLVRAKFEEEFQQDIRRPTVLSEAGGPRPWFDEWDSSQGYYWRRQRQYLVDQLGWQVRQVDSLDKSTDDILSHLEDPRPSGPAAFDVRGLVVGFVQSGKTANFCALTAKAADVGYKLVIVLSGIHNSLRQQTQRRLNRALGIDPKDGVPRPEPGKQWISLTRDDLHGDFHPGTTGPEVIQGNDHVLMVVKKNKTVLNRVVEWVSRGAPNTLPILVIDDESDQASVNTGGNRTDEELDDVTDLTSDDVDDDPDPDEIDPSVINGLVRTLLQACGRVSFVAYTATPFANVLTHHSEIDREVGQTLYPRDFIVSLPEPIGYVGAERVFGRDLLPGEDGDGRQGLDVIRHVPEDEANELTPSSREIPNYSARITASLEAAFLDFVLAIAARQHRSGKDAPATMLIHTHHRKPVQNDLAEVVRIHVAELRQLWRYDRDSLRPELVTRWTEEFCPVIASLDESKVVSFDEIEPHLDELFRDPLSVVLLNSDSKDELDYEAAQNIKTVVIGGNRLSRGLTLEGLLVSFYVRFTDCYDTLMQMGRWFGFRESYVDLTRIWTTALLARMFSDLALAEADLREEIKRYKREGLTPRLLGPKIRSHPFMLVTARNKMGSGQVVSQDYSQKLLQTTYFRLDDPAWLDANLAVTAEFVTQLGIPIEASNQHPFATWLEVSVDRVMDFFRQYQTDPRAQMVDMGAIRQYVQKQVENGELTRWCVSLRGLASVDPQLGSEPLLAVGGRTVACISRSQLKSVPGSIGTLVNGAVRGKPVWSGDEELGLDEGQIQAARGAEGRYGEALRSQRSPQEGLLLLYPISKYSSPSRASRKSLFADPEQGRTIVGLAVSFPYSDSDGTIEYVVGSVGVHEGLP